MSRLATVFADITPRAVSAGLMVALVGYASSVAIVIQGLRAVGASGADIASALLLLGLAKGAVAIGLSLVTRMPVSIAWTTPGLALLISVGGTAGGFADAVGAFILAGLMIAFAGLWPRLGALVVAIPKPIASAMLAGVLLKLCLAPFIALKALPVTAGAVILVWLILMRFARSAAVPVAALVALVSTIALAPPGTYDGVLQWPQVTLTTPTFSLEATVSLALPLFFVTMASQNITGLAVLATFGYHLKTSLAFVSTGLASVVIAPFGAPTVNLAAVTAALAAGPDAGPDPQKRYVAAVFSGIGYIMLALIAGLAAATVTRAPPLLIEAVAGLALIGAFSNAALAALNDETVRLSAAITFLTTASGLSIAGIGSAFLGLVFGLLVMGIERWPRQNI
ncbi:benzoate/H(+) symporter BenE family transporter [Candidatus Raskinella chloraquaticus]|uniref:Benzoate transporter n=1 Tax=Candidatus Raskinella chloraquaticus TaxID=1951219 RepID=A0A1W9I4P9_9HYPH|nr:MAG: hypothetical protein A4S15_14315 [Proteobacteria bacterium SG_bin8]